MANSGHSRPLDTGQSHQNQQQITPKFQANTTGYLRGRGMGLGFRNNKPQCQLCGTFGNLVNKRFQRFSVHLQGVTAQRTYMSAHLTNANLNDEGGEVHYTSQAAHPYLEMFQASLGLFQVYQYNLSHVPSTVHTPAFSPLFNPYLSVPTQYYFFACQLISLLN